MLQPLVESAALLTPVSSRSPREGAAGGEGEIVEPVRHRPVAGRVRMQAVGEVGEVVGTEQREPVDEMQVRRRRPRRDDLGRRVPGSGATSARRRRAPSTARQRRTVPSSRGGSARDGLRRRAEDRRRERSRRRRMTVADRVEEAVHRGTEGALAHGVAVDDVDAGLDADEVGRQVPDRAGDGLVEHALPREGEVLQIDIGEARDDRRPRLRRRRCASRQWLIELPWWIQRRRRPFGAASHRAVVDPQLAQLDDAVVRQPHLDGYAGVAGSSSNRTVTAADVNALIRSLSALT